MPETQSAPSPLSRPKIAFFIWERDLSASRAGEQLGRSRQWVQLICLPFDDPRRRIPDSEDMERIHTWSKGAITPADFYPPHLNDRDAVRHEGVEP